MGYREALGHKSLNKYAPPNVLCNLASCIVAFRSSRINKPFPYLGKWTVIEATELSAAKMVGPFSGIKALFNHHRICMAFGTRNYYMAVPFYITCEGGGGPFTKGGEFLFLVIRQPHFRHSLIKYIVNTLFLSSCRSFLVVFCDI